MSPQPPQLADRLLAWFCAPHLLEDIQGDLHELFRLRVERKGLRRARLRYWLDVIRFFRPYVLRRTQPAYQHARGPIMLKNYLKVALRTLQRQKGYAFINVAGLAVGVAACLLILLYVQDELSFDRFHEHADRIVRVVEARESTDQGDQHVAYTMGPLGPALVEEVPEVVQAVRLAGAWASGRMTVRHGEAMFYSGEHLFAEPSFFDLFDFSIRRGNPATMLNEPLSVVLTDEWARLLYGDEDPVGQTLHVERFGDFTVTGILEDPPPNSHLDFSMLFSFATLESIDGWREWLAQGESDALLTYLLLDEGASLKSVAPKMTAVFNRYWEGDEVRRPYLQTLADVHFGSAHIEFEENANKGARAYLYIFAAIALFIVLIACINYMNLATARSMRRAREVGMRKVVGAQRGQLIRQFLIESVLVAGIAITLAVGLAWAVLPTFNAFTGKALHLASNGWVFVGLAGLVVVIGAVAGSYPALYLSHFRPARVLRGALHTGTAAATLRRGLVVTQFALSILMLVATVVVYDQMQYVQTKRLGFNEEQLVVVDINDGGVRRDFETIKEEFARVPAVRAVSVSSNVPGDWKTIPQIDVAADATGDDALMTAHFLGVDTDFADTFELELLDGRTFSQDFATDSLSVLLNETAAARLGVTVGDRIRVPGTSLWSRFQDTEFQPRVIGVVRDFHFESLHKAIGPMVLGYWSNPIDVIDYFTIRVATPELPASVEALRAVGERFDPGHPFEYNFLDERLADFYRTEQRVGRLFGIAAGLAILIACLGLFGLAAYSAEQRTKEVGVRKVMGASVASLVALLSKDFLKLVGLAFIVAAPVGYLVMRQWLNNFAYQVELSWWIFALAGLAALLIALLTVSYQAVRTALADPVKSLRYE